MSARAHERELAALAARQHGVVSVDQLDSIGIDRNAVAHRVRLGRLHRVHVGVYAVGHPNLSPKGRWRAATLATDGVLSHGNAAALWELIRAPSGDIHVLSPTCIAHTRPGLMVHRTRWFEHLTVRDGIPVTTVPRTLYDLAGSVRTPLLLRALKEAELRYAGTERALAELLEATPGRPGAPRLRELLGLGLRSASEGRFLELCERHDTPSPVVNGRLMGKEVDFHWPRERLVVEIDGGPFHRSAATIEDDRRRDALLTAGGWTVLRFSSGQIRHEPTRVVVAVHAALASRHGLTGPRTA
jgi:hypothetical protein